MTPIFNKLTLVWSQSCKIKLARETRILEEVQQIQIMERLNLALCQNRGQRRDHTNSLDDMGKCYKKNTLSIMLPKMLISFMRQSDISKERVNLVKMGSSLRKKGLRHLKFWFKTLLTTKSISSTIYGYKYILSKISIPCKMSTSLLPKKGKTNYLEVPHT